MPLEDVYTGYYSDRYGRQPYTAPTPPTPHVLLRLPGGTPRLAVVPLMRGQRRGFRAEDGWEQVSDKFHTDGSRADLDIVDQIVAAVWATDAASATAVLKAKVDALLQDEGFRRVGGKDLVS